MRESREIISGKESAHEGPFTEGSNCFGASEEASPEGADPWAGGGAVCAVG